MAESQTRYVNAATILPPPLVKQLMEHCAGRIIYVPSQNQFYQQRRVLAIDLFNKGESYKAIASMAGVTERRIRQIIQEYRREQAIESEKN